jgi:hypothetical protein
VFCPIFHRRSEPASYSDDVKLVSTIIVICGPSTGTTFGVQPVVTKTTASRMLRNVFIRKKNRKLVFIDYASNLPET